MSRWMDGRMICDFTSFSTVFQSYQDDGRLIMKGCVQWSPIYCWEDFASSGDWTGSARSVGQHLTFMSRKSSILGLSKPEKCCISWDFHTYICTCMSIWNFMLSWVEHEKSFITSGPGHYTYTFEICRHYVAQKWIFYSRNWNIVFVIKFQENHMLWPLIY